MIPRAEKKPYWPLRYLSPEQQQYRHHRQSPDQLSGSEQVRKVGVGTMIVRLEDQKIWTIREKQRKAATARESGVVSIPLETRKPHEFITGNVIGALAEFPQLTPQDRLYWFDRESYKGRYELVPGVQADLVVLGYQGQAEANTGCLPHSHEVEGFGWLSVEELLQRDDLRQGVDGFLQLALEENWIDTVADGLQRPGIRTLNAHDLFYQYLQVREDYPDWSAPVATR